MILASALPRLWRPLATSLGSDPRYEVTDAAVGLKRKSDSRRSGSLSCADCTSLGAADWSDQMSSRAEAA